MPASWFVTLAPAPSAGNRSGLARRVLAFEPETYTTLKDQARQSATADPSTGFHFDLARSHAFLSTHPSVLSIVRVKHRRRLTRLRTVHPIASHCLAERPNPNKRPERRTHTLDLLRHSVTASHRPVATGRSDRAASPRLAERPNPNKSPERRTHTADLLRHCVTASHCPWQPAGLTAKPPVVWPRRATESEPKPRTTYTRSRVAASLRHCVTRSHCSVAT